MISTYEVTITLRTDSVASALAIVYDLETYAQGSGVMALSTRKIADK